MCLGVASCFILHTFNSFNYVFPLLLVHMLLSFLSKAKGGCVPGRCTFFQTVKLFNFASVTVFILKEEEDKNFMSFYQVKFRPVRKILLYYWLPGDRWKVLPITRLKVFFYFFLFFFFTNLTDLENLSCTSHVSDNNKKAFGIKQKKQDFEKIRVFNVKKRSIYDK